MNQYNRLLDPKKDIGRYSGTLAIYLLVMTLVTVLWEVLLGLTLAGSIRKDPSQVTEKLNALNVWAGIPYLISISIGLFLFNAYRKRPFINMILSTRDVRWLFPVFFILLAFLGFLKSFHLWWHKWLSTVWDHWPSFSNTRSRWYDWEIMDHALVCWIFWSYHRGILLPVGAGLRGMERYGKIFAIVMTAILFGLFHANLTSSFSRVSLV